ncbi:MAG: hypothetical protein U9Q21_02470 [Candidatus Auribacterota bacterium]|nr:hypothetical protein [Candidatus Auribacterota bacterium]
MPRLKPDVVIIVRIPSRKLSHTIQVFNEIGICPYFRLKLNGIWQNNGKYFPRHYFRTIFWNSIKKYIGKPIHPKKEAEDV